MNVKKGQQPPVVLPETADQQINDLLLRLGVPQIQRMIYERALTKAEQKKVDAMTGVTLMERFYAKSRNVSPQRAIVELALAADLLTQSKHDWLLREIGESPRQKPSATPPEIEWD